MQVKRLRKYRDFAFSGIRIGVNTAIQIVKDRDGATIIDYGLLAGLVSIAAFAGFQFTGTAVAGMFDSISTVFAASLQPSP